jgi:DNA-binding transcriptional ArsR family regulator
MTKKIELSSMKVSADKACGLMKVLSNRDRLMLLCQISLGESCVKDLEDNLDIHQPTLSQQLTVLRNENLVKTRKEGKNIYYSLDSDIAMSVISLLHTHYCKKIIN